MKTCHIVGAGSFSVPFAVGDADMVIAADGGYDRLIELGITPDLLIGDMDSIDSIPDGIELIRHPVRKDETDSFLAYREGLERGYSNFCLYGGVGGREDHTFANLSLLLFAANRGDRVRLVYDTGYALVVKNGSISLHGSLGDHLSVFAMGGNAEGVSLSGVDYEAENITLTPDFPLGVSNAFTEDIAHVKVESGALLVMVSYS